MTFAVTTWQQQAQHVHTAHTATTYDIHYIHRQQSANVMRLTPSDNVSHHWAGTIRHAKFQSNHHQQRTCIEFLQTGCRYLLLNQLSQNTEGMSVTIAVKSIMDSDFTSMPHSGRLHLGPIFPPPIKLQSAWSPINMVRWSPIKQDVVFPSPINAWS